MADGRFTGVGVGPGDPELMTLKAVRRIQKCDVIAVPVSDVSLEEPRFVKADGAAENECGGYEDRCVAYQIALGACPEMRKRTGFSCPCP